MDHRTGEPGERPGPADERAAAPFDGRDGRAPRAYDGGDVTVARAYDGADATAAGPYDGTGALVPYEAPAAFDAFGSAPSASAPSPSGPTPSSPPGPTPPALSGYTPPSAEPAAPAFDTFDGFARSGPGQSVGHQLPALPPAPSLFDSTAPLPKVVRPVRDPLAPELTAGNGTPSGGSSRVKQVVTGEYLLTVNPVDGTEVTACPPEARTARVRRTPQERAAHQTAARPAPPPGPPAPELPLLERDEERERLIRLLARGRSVRVTGPSGAGRTALLESVANACGDLAPEGVLWLSGYRRTPADLLQALYSTVYAGEGYRPDRAELAGLLREVGAVVVVDDLEFGGAALEEVLATAPECAFLMSAVPEVAAPAPESMVEDVFLSGLTRVVCIDLLQLVAGRPLEEDETAWAADLWFESEGLPLRFVQAGALLRQRDALRFPPEPDWDDSVWENGSPATAGAAPIPDLSGFDPPADPDAPLEIPSAAPPEPSAPRLPAADVPLPSLAESAAPADLLASRLSESAREALAFAVALDGECPHPSHLPALVGDTHGDAALGELTAVGLAVPVAAHYRLAAGVTQQLAVAFAAEHELSDIQAHSVALHYAWWSGHPSVTSERAAAESEAIIAAMTACRDNGHPTAAVLLARTVAPAFAAALHWGAWERALRVGQEAARLSGEVAEEAYFHHELGVLALCTGHTDRARAELEASIALRAALADRQGTVVGRRTLALVGDGVPAPLLELPPGTGSPAEPLAVIHERPPVHHAAPAPGPRRLAIVGTRRNLVAAGTGVVLAAVLGTIVTLGATSGPGGGADQDNQVKPIESAQQDAPDDPSTSEPGVTSAAAPVTTAPPTTPSSSAPVTAPASTPVGAGATSPHGAVPPQGGVSTPPPVATTTTSTSSGGHGSHPSHPVSTSPTTPSSPPPTTTTSPPPTTPTPTETTTEPPDTQSAPVASVPVAPTPPSPPTAPTFEVPTPSG